MNFWQIPHLELKPHKERDSGGICLMCSAEIDNSVSAGESQVLFKQSSQPACLLSTCLCVNTVLYLCFGRDRKMREVV